MPAWAWKTFLDSRPDLVSTGAKITQERPGSQDSFLDLERNLKDAYNSGYWSGVDDSSRRDVDTEWQAWVTLENWGIRWAFYAEAWAQLNAYFNANATRAPILNVLPSWIAAGEGDDAQHARLSNLQPFHDLKMSTWKEYVANPQLIQAGQALWAAMTTHQHTDFLSAENSWVSKMWTRPTGGEWDLADDTEKNEWLNSGSEWPGGASLPGVRLILYARAAADPAIAAGLPHFISGYATSTDPTLKRYFTGDSTGGVTALANLYQSVSTSTGHPGGSSAGSSAGAGSSGSKSSGALLAAGVVVALLLLKGK